MTAVRPSSEGVRGYTCLPPCPERSPSVTEETTMQHPDHYTLNESARRAVLLFRGGWRAHRGKPTGKYDRALDKLAEEARDREAKAKKK